MKRVNKTKPKLLAWCDFVAPTGFGNVAKNLLRDMYKDYEVSIVGINYRGDQKYDNQKYFVYSTTNEDALGVKKLFKAAKTEQPDLIFLFQDIFNITSVIDELKKLAPKAKIVTYFPIDGGPLSVTWANVLNQSDVVITYTDWAISMLKETFPDFKKPIHKLYHGVDINVFRPISKIEISSLRKSLEWTDKFVVINVNRFQPRKGIPITIRAFSFFAKGYKKCRVCGHVMPLNVIRCELNGCPVDQLEEYHNPKKDVMLYLHMHPSEISMGGNGTNLLQNHMMAHGFTGEDNFNIIALNGKNIYGGEVSEHELNKIYNIANLNVSTTFGEGCGLSLLESQAAGTPSVAPNNSAIPEMLNGTGTLVKNIAMYSQAHDNAFIRPIVDPFEFYLTLEKYYKEWKESGEEKVRYEAGIENIKQNFLWDDKRELLRSIFEEVLKKRA